MVATPGAITRISSWTRPAVCRVIPGSPIRHRASITISLVGFCGMPPSSVGIDTSGASFGRPAHPSPTTAAVPASQNAHHGGTGTSPATYGAPKYTPTASANANSTSPRLRPGISFTTHTKISAAHTTPNPRGHVHANTSAATTPTSEPLVIHRAVSVARRSSAATLNSFVSRAPAWWWRRSAVSLSRRYRAHAVASRPNPRGVYASSSSAVPGSCRSTCHAVHARRRVIATVATRRPTR